MRVRKQKLNRKAVRFYAACFGFREPYKVLCDGTFVHHLVSHQMAPADDVVAKMLGGRCLLFSTTCVHGEIGSLGRDYAEALRAAKELVTARCSHEKRVHAVSCIQEVVADGNPEHFFVATQDSELREKLRGLPGVPVIYALKNTLFVEKPSSAVQQFLKSTEEKRLHMTEREAEMMGRRKMREAPQQATEDGDDDEVSTRKRKLAKATVGDNWQFKRKVAKGPNPLSCKKKKPKVVAPATSQTSKDDNATNRKRIRKRNRSKSGSKVGDGGAGNL